MAKPINTVSRIFAALLAFAFALPAAADVLVFGGTRGVGLETVRLIAASGEPVTVLVRATSKTEALKEIDGVKLVVGDAMQPDTVAAAFASGNFDAAISTLSGRPSGGYKVDSEGSINAMEAALAAGTRRFILVSSIGAGDSRTTMPEAVLKVLGVAMEQKTLAENHLMASALDYTIIRPGTLINKDPNGLGILTTDTRASGRIRRVEVARLIVESLRDPDTIGQVYSAIEKSDQKKSD